jgi:parallel beta-helix repeat protein
MKNLLFIYIVLTLLLTNVSYATLREVCATCTYTTITDALTAASDGDTIQVDWESAIVSVYNEKLSISKEITLTSDQHPTGDDYETCPIITYTLGENDNIITVNHENVTISNLRVRAQPLSGQGSDDAVNMTHQAGIRIDNGDCTIRNCQIQACRAGILISESLNNKIDRCELGKLRENSEWTPPDEYGSHPGNFFGIVQFEPPRSTLGSSTGSYRGNEISNCRISRNRFYGIVLRGGSMATVRNNLIVWNGTGTELSGDHYGDGGILCLFDSNEMSATDVLISSPLVMSNTVYGNDGYQVCVITDNSDLKPTDIRNAPIIMSNILGPSPFIDQVSRCVPIVSCSSESEGAQVTPQYGSAPIMAFNDLYEATPGCYFLNPAQTPYTATPTFTPSGPTMTPTPAPSISTPTGTMPPTSVYTPPWEWTNTPTGTHAPTSTPQPWYTRVPTFAPTPSTPLPTETPFYSFKAYVMESEGWSILNNFGDPKFVAGDQISNFDFHLQDPLNPTPGATPSPRSACINRGGLNLDPGITRADDYPDVDQVDIGMHFRSVVPSVSRLEIRNSGASQTLQWTQPTHYADGRLFSDLIGNILSFGEYDSQTGEIAVIRSKFMDPCSSCEFAIVPPGCTHVGISVYNARGDQSQIIWVELGYGTQVNP